MDVIQVTLTIVGVLGLFFFPLVFWRAGKTQFDYLLVDLDGGIKNGQLTNQSVDELIDLRQFVVQHRLWYIFKLGLYVKLQCGVCKIRWYNHRLNSFRLS